MNATPTVLVPLRAPGVGKTRLAGRLSRRQRAELAGAMLSDVAAALTSAPVGPVVVVAGGAAAVAAATELGLPVLLDPPGVGDLDTALAAAARRIGPVDALLVVAADLPRLDPDDIVAVVDRDADVVVAPTVDGGTGALLRRPGGVIATAYGPGSAARHRQLAIEAGCRVELVHRPGLAHDVDTATDLAALAAAPIGPATRRAIADLIGGDARAV